MNYLKALLIVSIIVLFGDSASESFAKNPAVSSAWLLIAMFGLVAYCIARSNRQPKR